MKALFIPVKAVHFAAFASGNKSTEYRVYGKRFNERTCYLGREVVISRGYGRQHRLQGRITSFHTSIAATQTAEWRDCYGDAGGLAACIEIELN